MDIETYALAKSYTDKKVKNIDVAGEVAEQLPNAVADYCDEHYSEWSGALDSALESKVMAAPADKVGELKSALTDNFNVDRVTFDGIVGYMFNYAEEKWCQGSAIEQYTTSTFSGFSTNWNTTEDEYVKSLVFSVRSREETNITKIKVRIEVDDFVFERLLDVNIGTTMTDIEFPIDAIIPHGTVWVGIAANKQATFYHSNYSYSYNYHFWTNGNISDLSDLKTGNGSICRLYISVNKASAEKYLKTVKTTDIVDNAVIDTKTNFARKVLGNNLANSADFIKHKWYAKVSGTNTVKIVGNDSTTDYTCVPIYVKGLSKITFCASTAPAARYYDWFAVAEEIADDDTAIPYIQMSATGFVGMTTPVTIDIPEGTLYILLSANKLYDYPFMANSGTQILPYEDYMEKIQLYGKTVEIAEQTPTLMLPSSYNLVVGDTFQLFKKGIINAVNTDLFDVTFTCSIGSAYIEFFEVTPTETGTVTLTVDLYNQNRVKLDTKQVSLVVSAKPSSPLSTKYVLCVGDSLTTDGQWPEELHRRLVGTGGIPTGDELTNIQFIGSKSRNGVNYEGYGGYNFYSYNSQNVTDNAKVITCTHDKTEAEDQHSVYKDSSNNQWKLETIENGYIKIMIISGDSRTFPATGTLTWVSGGTNHNSIVYTASTNAPSNPFWDEDNSQVDFSAYCTSLGVPTIDYVVVLLGWNMVNYTEAYLKEQAQLFIDNVHDSYPSAKIILMGIGIPARDGLGKNYGASGVWVNYYNLVQYVKNLDGYYADIADDNSATVVSVNIAGQFDTNHNMQTATRQVNTRNTETETYQSNGVHPAYTGYMQIADAAYRTFVTLL